MNGTDNLNEMIEKVLSDDESREKLMSLAKELFSGGESDSEEKEDSVVDASFEEPQNAIAPVSIQSVYKTITGGNDKRVRLLTALKPYMNGKHASGIDNAITLVQLATISSNLGISKIFERRENSDG